MAEEIKAVPKMVQMAKSTTIIAVPAELVPHWEKSGFKVVVKDPQKQV
jgi:hypothetical protein